MERSIELGYVLGGLKSGLKPVFDFPAAPAGLQWTEVARILQAGRLSSHFYMLGKDRQDEWPAEFREILRRDRISLAMYSDQCSAKVRAVLSALQHAGIQVIVLKGWAYIQTIYGGDAGQRVCEDIDLLVHPKQTDAVEDVLNAIGLQGDLESWPGYARRYLNGRRYFFEAFSNIPGSTFSIGLHWGLLNMPSYDPRRIDMDGIFSRAQPLQVMGVDVLQLGIVDHLVYACAHAGLHHRFETTIFREYEIAHLILAGVDWRDAVDRAVEWQCVLPMLFMLQRIHVLWGDVIPEKTMDYLSAVRPSRMEKCLSRWIRLLKGRKTFDHLLVWMTFPKWHQRLLIALQDIFPSPGYMRQRYGKSDDESLISLYALRFFRALQFTNPWRKTLQR